ncbi:hypothetical protein Q1695_012122 [Nippostrongylus brasiliensis]|nr:hypothetical protein Q1695_012122 [Nippostrongylus brasiliensis]
MENLGKLLISLFHIFWLILAVLTYVSCSSGNKKSKREESKMVLSCSPVSPQVGNTPGSVPSRNPAATDSKPQDKPVINKKRSMTMENRTTAATTASEKERNLKLLRQLEENEFDRSPYEDLQQSPTQQSTMALEDAGTQQTI